MEELIDIVDIDEVMQYKLFDDIHIWPLVRYTCLLGIRNIDHSTRNTASASLKEKLINLFIGISNLKIRKAKIVFITSVLFNTKMDGKKNRNIIDDYYLNVFPRDSYIYEYLAPDTFKTAQNRENNNVSNILSYMDIFITLVSKFSINKKKPDIERFLKYLRDKNISEETVLNVNIRLVKHAKEYKVRKFMYQIFLRIVQPKILFINCASYGEKHAIMINEARKRDVIIAEIQHGGIAKTDVVYNSTHPIKEYKQYMPDYLMTFGNYYNNIGDYSIKIPLGHPHIDNKVSKSNGVKKNSYLVISQWPILDELVNLAESLSITSPESTINYRLHPLDNLSIEQTKKLKRKNILITRSLNGKDLYDEFSLYENIVGCYSTALLEATAFNKKIYVLKHKLAIQYNFDKVGVLIENGYDIIKNNDQVKSHSFFISGFRDRYKKFIDSLNI